MVENVMTALACQEEEIESVRPFDTIRSVDLLCVESDASTSSEKEFRQREIGTEQMEGVTIWDYHLSALALEFLGNQSWGAEPEGLELTMEHSSPPSILAGPHLGEVTSEFLDSLSWMDFANQVHKNSRPLEDWERKAAKKSFWSEFS